MSRLMILIGLFLTEWAVPSAFAQGKPPRESDLALRTAEALYAGIRTEELDNGLKVYLKPIPGSTSVATVVAYKVGSGDEDKEFTGLAHYLEHLMFKGTEKLKPGDVDRITYRNGGSNNAYTNTDVTAYHFNLPAGRWLPALQVEADRMRNLRIDKEHEFDKEKGNVISELAGNEDQPWDLEYKTVLPMLFGPKHPYGHPVIGEAQHVRDATEKVIKDYYDRWYHPNNASLILVGGFDADEALKEIRKLFGPIAKGKLPERQKLPEKTPALPSRREVKSKFSVARLLLGYPGIRSGDPDEAALTVLAGVLSQGKRSRLYRGLVEGAAVCSSASADVSPGRYPGWIGVYAEVLPGKNRIEVEKLLLAEIDAVRTKKVPEEELLRVKQQLLAAAIFGRESSLRLAQAIGEAVTLTDLDTARKFLPNVMAVTADDVLRVAQKYLDPKKSATVWTIPGAAEKGGAGVRVPSRTLWRQPAEGKSEGGFDLKKTKRVVLDNGLTVLLFPNRRLPTFEARVSLRMAGIFQPDEKLGVATLTGSMLDEGTTERTGPQIAEAIENVGGILSVSGSGGSVRVLSPQAKLGMSVLLECVTQPSFPDKEFRQVQARLLAEIGEEETQPDYRARRAFDAAVYGKHPLGRPSSGTLATVKDLKAADCVAFHKRVFVPNNAMVSIVGDFDEKTVLADLTALTKNWKKADLVRPDLPKVELPEKFVTKVITMPEASQVQFYMGNIGIRRKNPDYYKLLVMDYVLGTGPGFTDRLSGRLRDREGLAYSVSATITSAAGLEPGTFTCFIGTDAQHVLKAKTLFLEELNRIRDTKASDTEVGDAKTYLIGSAMLQYSTNAGIAAELLTIERYDLGFNYLEDYKKGVASVTVADIQEVARKYIHPDRLVLAAAGAINDKLEPLQKK